MRVFRQILGDRVAGAGALVLAIQFLVLQAFFSSITCGMTVAAASPAICHGLQSEADAPAPHRDSSGICLDCPCGIACSAGAAVLAELAPEQDLGAAFSLVAGAGPDLPVDQDTDRISPTVALAPDPTGPPAFSI
ncbi:MAG TPA: hypothetical protein VGO17_06500 [Aurantimonas sp.]|jgi:hypothetical protein|nr:hypothetical protein [Aurantimonas sp.]